MGLSSVTQLDVMEQAAERVGSLLLNQIKKLQSLRDFANDDVVYNQEIEYPGNSSMFS